MNTLFYYGTTITVGIITNVLISDVIVKVHYNSTSYSCMREARFLFFLKMSTALVQMHLMMSRDLIFQQATKFRAEPWNLPFAAKFPYFH